MSVDLKDLETTPTLSLDPFGEAEKEPEVPGSSLLRRQSNRLLM